MNDIIYTCTIYKYNNTLWCNHYSIPLSATFQLIMYYHCKYLQFTLFKIKVIVLNFYCA